MTTKEECLREVERLGDISEDISDTFKVEDLSELEDSDQDITGIDKGRFALKKLCEYLPRQG